MIKHKTPVYDTLLKSAFDMQFGCLDDLLDQAKKTAGLPHEAHAILLSDVPGWEPKQGDQAEMVVLGHYAPSRRRPIPSILRTRGGVTLTLRPQNWGAGTADDEAVAAWKGHPFCAPTAIQRSAGQQLCQHQGVLMVSFDGTDSLCAWVFKKGKFVNGARALPKQLNGFKVRVLDGGFLHFVPTEYSGVPHHSEPSEIAPALKPGLVPTPELMVHADGLGQRTECSPHMTALVVTQFASGHSGYMKGRESRLWLVAYRSRRKCVLDCAFTGDTLETKQGGVVAGVLARFGEYLCGPLMRAIKE